eukprot:2662399-Prymnesium_polylepis.1
MARKAVHGSEPDRHGWCPAGSPVICARAWRRWSSFATTAVDTMGRLGTPHVPTDQRCSLMPVCEPRAAQPWEGRMLRPDAWTEPNGIK